MIRVELHTHTKYSHDCTHTFGGIVNRCLQRKIDVVAITDHNEIEGAFRLAKMAPFRVIIGEEILTKNGEIIGLFLKKFIPPGLLMKETIERIKKVFEPMICSKKLEVLIFSQNLHIFANI